MSEIWQQLLDVSRAEEVGKWISGLLVLGIGYLLARLARRSYERLFHERLSPQHVMLGGRVVYYTIFGLALAAAVQESGAADLKIFLGAAGILTVALGFASQTSASNLISGLFLVGESAFVVGDAIQVGSTTGIVQSIDFLSVKILRFDNVLVRIPNETALKSEIVNLSRFPIRRLDLTIGVAYKEDMRKVKEVLLAVAATNPYALDEPEPLVFFNGYGDSAVHVRFSAWFTREKFFEAHSRFQEEVYAALNAADVEIPFPHVSLYAGSVTEPFPVRWADTPGGA
jgi:small-conductance mechanosensitive channel